MTACYDAGMFKWNEVELQNVKVLSGTPTRENSGFRFELMLTTSVQIADDPGRLSIGSYTTGAFVHRKGSAYHFDINVTTENLPALLEALRSEM